MRKISAWVAIIAMPTMIAGVYGMNFENMPELGWSLGYPFALGLMTVAGVGLYALQTAQLALTPPQRDRLTGLSNLQG